MSSIDTWRFLNDLSLYWYDINEVKNRIKISKERLGKENKTPFHAFSWTPFDNLSI